MLSLRQLLRRLTLSEQGARPTGAHSRRGIDRGHSGLRGDRVLALAKNGSWPAGKRTGGTGREGNRRGERVTS